jgi:hypothetical protein
MARMNLDGVGRWSPLIESLVKRFGRNTAITYGVIWGYANMEDGHCRASHNTIGIVGGISRAAVQRSVIDLVANGYITEKHTLGEPTKYWITDKIKMRMLMIDQGDTCITEQQDLHHGDTPPVSQSNTNRTLNRTEKNLSPKPASADTYPKTNGSVYLFVQLEKIYRSIGRTAPKHFKNVVQREVFEAIEAKHTKESMKSAIDTTLSTGITALPRLISYIAKIQPPPPQNNGGERYE